MADWRAFAFPYGAEHRLHFALLRALVEWNANICSTVLITREFASVRSILADRQVFIQEVNLLQEWKQIHSAVNNIMLVTPAGLVDMLRREAGQVMEPSSRVELACLVYELEESYDNTGNKI